MIGAGETRADRERGGGLRRPTAYDAVAGISVAVVLVPQSLAYAQLAGFPAYRGLFAAAIPPLVAAPFASSPYLQPGPTAVSALLTYGALSPLAPVGSGQYLALGAVLALLVGAVRLAIGLLRAGELAYILSQPLLVGFVPAAAILIVCSQLPLVLGIPGRGENGLYRVGWVLGHVDRVVVPSLVVAALAAGIIAAGRRWHPLFPAVLLAVVGTTALSAATRYGGATLGRVHTGFPPVLRSVPLGSVPELVVPAIVIAVIGFAEAASIARTYATADRTPWDPNREFASQGLANLSSGIVGAFPVGASFSRSALNRLAGARSSASALVTGVAVLIFLPFGSVLESLPRAVLGATVILAVVPLIRLDRIVALLRLSWIQGTVTITAFVLTLALSPHIEWAIVAAIAVSVAVHLWREMRLDLGATSTQDALEIAPEGVLWFGTAGRLEDRFTTLLAEHPNHSHVVIRLDRLGRIDLSGALALQSIVGDCRRAGLTVELRGSPAHSRRILGRVLPNDVVASD